MKKYLWILMVFAMSLITVNAADSIFTMNGNPIYTLTSGEITFNTDSSGQKVLAVYENNKLIDVTLENKITIGSINATTILKGMEFDTLTNMKPLHNAFVLSNKDTSFQVAKALGDNMVVQRDEPLCLWGTSDSENAEIIVSFRGHSAKATVKNGKFELTLAPLTASAVPETMTFYSVNGRKIELKNVLTGDVWLAAGQSNMQAYVGNPGFNTSDNIRMIRQDKMDIEGLGNIDYSKEYENPVAPNAIWKFPEFNFSQIAYHFAKTIIDGTNNTVPVGIVTVGAPGSPLCEFTPKALADTLGYTNPKRGYMYNTMISPYKNMSIKGMIWYQGESDFDNYTNYPSHFVSFINQLKENFREDFPVYIMELPSIYTGTTDNPLGWQFIDFGKTRAAMGNIVNQLENSYICTTSDMWKDKFEWNNLHPYVRPQMATRMGKMALYKEYGIGQEKLSFGPIAKTAKLDSTNDKNVVITFDYAGDILKTRDNEFVKGILAFDSNDQSIAITKAYIVANNKVIVKCERTPANIRYSSIHSDSYTETVNISNSENIPAGAFWLNVSGTETLENPFPEPEPGNVEEVIIYEAENATVYQDQAIVDMIGIGNTKVVDNALASGGKYVTNWLIPGNNTSITFNVNVPAEGTYTFNMKFYINSSEFSNPLTIYVNGTGASKTLGVNGKLISAIPAMNSFIKSDNFTLDLQAGDNTVTFGGGTPLMNFGVDCLCRVILPTDPKPAPNVTIFEAENATVYQDQAIVDLIGVGNTRVVDNALASGGKFVTNWLIPGINTSITFDVNVPTAGTYTFYMKYYINSAEFANPLTIYLNGTGASKTSGVNGILISATPVMDSFIKSDNFTLELQAGNNTITFGGGSPLMNFGVDCLCMIQQ